MSIPTDEMPDGHVKTIVLMSRDLEELRASNARLQTQVNEARGVLDELTKEADRIYRTTHHDFVGDLVLKLTERARAWLAANPEVKP